MGFEERTGSISIPEVRSWLAMNPRIARPSNAGCEKIWTDTGSRLMYSMIRWSLKGVPTLLLMDRDIGAIYCFINECDWWVPEPPGITSCPERDDVVSEHIKDDHTVQEVLQEIHRRIIELGPEPREQFTREQIEDRNSIIYLLRAVIGLPPYGQLARDP